MSQGCSPGHQAGQEPPVLGLLQPLDPDQQDWELTDQDQHPEWADQRGHQREHLNLQSSPSSLELLCDKVKRTLTGDENLYINKYWNQTNTWHVSILII